MCEEGPEGLTIHMVRPGRDSTEVWTMIQSPPRFSGTRPTSWEQLQSGLPFPTASERLPLFMIPTKENNKDKVFSSGVPCGMETDGRKCRLID